MSKIQDKGHDGNFGIVNDNKDKRANSGHLLQKKRPKREG